jgi:threonine/homoserine/homoserine lactone efflux protein
MNALTDGYIDANKVVVGVALGLIVLFTLAYLLRRVWRRRS